MILNMLEDDIFFTVVFVNRVECGVMIDIIFRNYLTKLIIWREGFISKINLA